MDSLCFPRYSLENNLVFAQQQCKGQHELQKLLLPNELQCLQTHTNSVIQPIQKMQLSQAAQPCSLSVGA